MTELIRASQFKLWYCNFLEFGLNTKKKPDFQTNFSPSWSWDALKIVSTFPANLSFTFVWTRFLLKEKRVARGPTSIAKLKLQTSRIVDVFLKHSVVAEEYFLPKRNGVTSWMNCFKKWIVSINQNYVTCGNWLSSKKCQRKRKRSRAWLDYLKELGFIPPEYRCRFFPQ